jgi:peptide/nickel transport system permease protein
MSTLITNTPTFDGYLDFPSSQVPSLPKSRSVLRGLHLDSLRPGLILAGLFLLFLVVAAFAPTWITSRDPLETHLREAFRAPSAAHVLGTDENGRDVFTRIIYGVRGTLFMGLGATFIGLGSGIVLGLISGLGPRLVDGAIMRFVDILLAFPDLLFALVIITFFGQGTLNAILAVGIASIPRYARLTRAQTHLVRGLPYVEAASTLGLRHVTLVLRHVLPNAIRPVIVLAIVGLGGKIAIGASLSFLGLGTPAPAPEWGSMLSVGRDFLANAWWLTAMPGFALTLTVLSIGTLGRELLRRSEGKNS